MKLSDILVEGLGDTETIRRLITSGQIRIPSNPETGMPTPSSPEAWKEFFEGEHEQGVDFGAVDWDAIHEEFYV